MNAAQGTIAQTSGIPNWFYNMKVVFSITIIWQLIQKKNSLSQKRNAAATKVAWFYGLFLFEIWIGLYSIVENHWR